jgi:hypothetical protein
MVDPFRDSIERYGAVGMALAGKQRPISPLHFLGRETCVKFVIHEGKTGALYESIKGICPKWGNQDCDPFPGIPEPMPGYVSEYDPYKRIPKRPKHIETDVTYHWGYALVDAKDGFCHIKCIGFEWMTHKQGGVIFQHEILDCVQNRNLIGKVTCTKAYINDQKSSRMVWADMYAAFGFQLFDD